MMMQVTRIHVVVHWCWQDSVVIVVVVVAAACCKTSLVDVVIHMVIANTGPSGGLFP